MSSHYMLQGSPEKRDIFVDKVEAPEEFFEPLNVGKRLKEPSEPVRLLHPDPKRRKTDLLNGHFPFIDPVSRRFREVIETYAKDDRVQWIPVQLVCYTTGEVDEDFFFFNPLDQVDAMDHDRSEAIYPVPGTRLLPTIKRLVLDKSKLRGRHVVRLEESPTVILVSDEIRRAVIAAGLIGLKFGDPEAHLWF